MVPEAAVTVVEVDAAVGAGVVGGADDGAEADGVDTAGGGPAGGGVMPGMSITSPLAMLHGFEGVPLVTSLLRILSMWFLERQQTTRRSTT